MIENSILILCTALYLAVLFYLAFRADQSPKENLSRFQPTIYTLSLTVYCTSWTFYGAVGSAARTGWGYFTIYLGPILVFIFLFPFLQKIIATAKRHKTTSIADFIATRYGKSNRLSALVAVIAFVGTMPYIALQIKAIANSYDTLTGVSKATSFAPFGDTAFALAIILAVFSILFGARTIDATQHHKGLIYAISFEAIVKLIAFAVIAFLAFDIVAAIASQSSQQSNAFNLMLEPFPSFNFSTDMITKTFLAAGAIFLLPRQFHVLAVEARGNENMSRWGLPLYLLLFSIAVIPITSAGLLLVEGQENADLFVLMIPMLEQSNFLSILGYLGGFSAATGMVIVATIALSTMVSNELIFPLLVRFYHGNTQQEFHSILLFVRRATIFALMLLAYGYYFIGGAEKSLQSVGLISFAAAIQFLPAILGAVYWRKGHRDGVIAGLILGFSIWIYSLLLPSLANSTWIPIWFLNLLSDSNSLINPIQLLGIHFDDSLTHGVFWSLLLNSTAFILISLRATPSLVDRLQSASYIEHDKKIIPIRESYQFKVSDLFELCIRFTGEERTREYFLEHGYDVKKMDTESADHDFTELSERLLASSIGTATAERLIRTAQIPEGASEQKLYEFIDETGQAIEFNRELLQVTLDHIGQAVSVVDDDLRLVGWNRQYIDFFNYPANFIRSGKPIEEVIRFNANKGYGPDLTGDIESKIKQRLEFLRHGNQYVFVREWQNGKVIQTEGARMPDGGYITTYTDITPLKKAEKRLEAINETLEAKVEERTEMLSVVNQQLEEVLDTKTHFLAAASHDLLQPLGASKLYLGALQEDLADDESKLDLANNALGALKTAESLLKSLLNLSKMDSGLLQPEISTFKIQNLFNSIENEFAHSAEQKGLKFKIISNNYLAISDHSLFLSVLQNLVANAIRYTDSGSVVVLCRLKGKDQLQLEVRDTGPGIAKEQQQIIFQAFKQLGSSEGVGLGLAIVEQAVNLLGHELLIDSKPGLGSCFKVTIPRYRAKNIPTNLIPNESLEQKSIEGLNVICVDDDSETLNATQSLLKRWGIQVTAVQTVDSFKTLIKAGNRYDVVVMDYQLGDSLNGLDLLHYYQQNSDSSFFGIMMTAEQDSQIKQSVKDAGFKFLAKPAEPAKIRSLFQSYLSRSL